MRARQPKAAFCVQCGERFDAYDSKAKYCSRVCAQRYRRATHPGEAQEILNRSRARRTPEQREYWRARNRSYGKENAERLKEKKRARNKQIREEALAAYGGHCACCGEHRRAFLALDHIEGGGRQHRAAKKYARIALWLYSQFLKTKTWPEGFRVLCHNCNQARGLYGYCPHERGLAKRIE